MHETIVAQSIFETILSETEKHGGRPIAVKISCGILSAINEETLQFAFEAIAAGTACEGIKIEMEKKKPEGLCKNCCQQFDVEIDTPRCPNCESEQFDLQRDAPLVIEEIEFDSE